MKRTIITAAIIGLAANAFAFQSSEVSRVLRDQLKGTVNADISQLATADLYNATKDGVSDLGTATKNDAVSAGKNAVKAAKRVGKEVSEASESASDFVTEKAISVGNFVTDETLAPSYQDLLVPTGKGIKSAALWIVEDLPEYVSAGVSNVYYALEFSAGAVVGDNGITGTAKATAADASALSQVKISQTNTADTANGISNAATVGQSKDTSNASSDFSSSPVDSIRQYKKQRVLALAKKAGERIAAYGADSKQAEKEFVRVGKFAAAQAGEVVNTDEAYALGVLFTKAIQM